MSDFLHLRMAESGGGCKVSKISLLKSINIELSVIWLFSLV
jgi:hypothetical protein